MNTSLLTSKLSRVERWSKFVNEKQCISILEIGVFRGEFAVDILQRCPVIKDYYMLDPWRNMNEEEWNSLYNFSQDMDKVYGEALEKTKAFAEKRKVLRGTTIEKIDEIGDSALDFIYIDGDHSLKGVSVDLMKSWSKVKEDGYIAGHDFKPLAWKNKVNMEPYLVFPFAVYFAEAMGVKIYGLPSNEFLIAKAEKGFEFIDLSDNKRFRNLDVLSQVYRLPFRYLVNVFFRKLLGR